eukprot:Cvel_14158.t1-p1 / transcript=Cvel_14158.t1 / gene=Cvel_14158 / organism=Chromera_velia_CCMP2878 / gene_product=hypothetical protein / transcript_product=hypothetical protein / location=Cvel_scaffold997:43675-44121(-) / protein_length=149 / sequence_SO=supercontig / SO=protein_coding / is_pseudo=false
MPARGRRTPSTSFPDSPGPFSSFSNRAGCSHDDGHLTLTQVSLFFFTNFFLFLNFFNSWWECQDLYFEGRFDRPTLPINRRALLDRPKGETETGAWKGLSNKPEDIPGRRDGDGDGKDLETDSGMVLAASHRALQTDLIISPQPSELER